MYCGRYRAKCRAIGLHGSNKPSNKTPEFRYPRGIAINFTLDAMYDNEYFSNFNLTIAIVASVNYIHLKISAVASANLKETLFAQLQVYMRRWKSPHCGGDGVHKDLQD